MRLIKIFGVALLLGTVFSGEVAGQTRTRTISVDALLYDLKHPDAERRQEAAR